MDLSRRKLLRTGIGALTSLAGASLISRAAAATCGITPVQTQGPFYPEHDQLDKDSDLTWVGENPKDKASGQVIYIEGTVRDEKCAPVAGALVEIWQACETGRYNHSGDPNPAALDPNFQYWGQAITDQNGKYLFKTIKPGAYPADVDWMRPPHIHYKVSKVGFHEMITQLYFEGDKYNKKDKILLQVPAHERALVITALRNPDLTSAQEAAYDSGSLVGGFDLTLKRV